MRQKQVKDNLRKFRKEKVGYTQQQVADYLKISRSTYTYYETGKTEPDLASIQKLAKLFGVTVGELLGSESPPRAMKDPIANRKKWSASSGLNYEEESLVLAFRNSPPEIQKKVEDLLEGYRQKRKTKPQSKE